MTDTLPAAAYTWADTLSYLAAFLAHELVWKSIAAFIAVSLAVLAVRAVFKIERT